MSQSFRLVFRGEVLDGQHAAVVRKRLMQALNMNPAMADRLFGGKAVVVKKEADAATAAQFEALFQKAGAKLRRIPIETVQSHPDSPPRDQPAASDGSAEFAERSSHTPSVAAEAEFDVAPVGADVLAHEHKAKDLAEAPDTSHLVLDEVGATLAVSDDEPPPAVPDPDFDLAEVGADIGDGTGRPAPVEIDVDFDVADVGADIGERKDDEPPPPNTDHIKLVG